MQINLAPDWSLLAIVAIFILNYIVVRKFFFQPVNAVLEARESETKTAEELYEESLVRFNSATSQMEEKLHAAKREAADLRDKFRAEAAAYRADVVTKHQIEGQQIIRSAMEQLAADVKAAREKIVRDAESLARLAAERILGRPV
jgi:F-type H+-transporting ATPase subunit b